MEDSRLLVPVDATYIEAIGRATYVFATLEWNAVWCCEILKPGYVRALKRKTAGDIAKDLVRLVNKIDDFQIKAKCIGPAVQFKNLVEVRNGIMHGKPGSSPYGDQLLYRDGSPWTCDLINKHADEFALCSQQLNTLFHTNMMGAPP